MADPDLGLRGGGGGLDLLALSAIFPSVISSFFTQNKGGGGGQAGPSPRSATVKSYLTARFIRHISAVSNAIETIDNEMICFIIYCLNCIRHGRNATYERGLNFLKCQVVGGLPNIFWAKPFFSK